jgi:hypothetical protein
MRKEEKIFIVTEGEFDTQFLKSLFNGKIGSNVEFWNGSGHSSALSIARSLLMKFPEITVVLLMDTDTTDKSQVREKKLFISSYLNETLYGNRLKLILFEPEIEALLFASKDILHQVTGMRAIPDVVWEVGKVNPRLALKKMLKNKSTKFYIDLLKKNRSLSNQIIKSSNDLNDLYELFSTHAVKTQRKPTHRTKAA